MKIALLGQFGSGNIGNDGSLQAMRDFLLEVEPTPKLLCICSDPETVQRSLKMKSISISVDDPGNGTLHSVARLRRRIANLRYSFETVRHLDLLVIPGMGILDDFKERPFGWPYCLLRWCAMARLARTPVAFVSVGAGPATNRLSRFFFYSQHAAPAIELTVTLYRLSLCGGSAVVHMTATFRISRFDCQLRWRHLARHPPGSALGLE